MYLCHLILLADVNPLVGIVAIGLLATLARR
jgi:hypothetical protein